MREKIPLKMYELYLKKYTKNMFFMKKSVAKQDTSMYTNSCCGMIAVKREVAGLQK